MEIIYLESFRDFHSVRVCILVPGKLPKPADDPRQRQPDISLAKKGLGWEPKVQLQEGLKKTIVYFDELLRAASS